MCMYPLALQSRHPIFCFKSLWESIIILTNNGVPPLNRQPARFQCREMPRFFQGTAHIGETDVHTAKQLYARRCGCNDRTPVWGIGCTNTLFVAHKTVYPPASDLSKMVFPVQDTSSPDIDTKNRSGSVGWLIISSKIVYPEFLRRHGGDIEYVGLLPFGLVGMLLLLCWDWYCLLPPVSSQ